MVSFRFTFLWLSNPKCALIALQLLCIVGFTQNYLHGQRLTCNREKSSLPNHPITEISRGKWYFPLPPAELHNLQSTERVWHMLAMGNYPKIPLVLCVTALFRPADQTPHQQWGWNRSEDVVHWQDTGVWIWEYIHQMSIYEDNIKFIRTTSIMKMAWVIFMTPSIIRFSCFVPLVEFCGIVSVICNL